MDTEAINEQIRNNTDWVAIGEIDSVTGEEIMYETTTNADGSDITMNKPAKPSWWKQIVNKIVG